MCRSTRIRNYPRLLTCPYTLQLSSAISPSLGAAGLYTPTSLPPRPPARPASPRLLARAISLAIYGEKDPDFAPKVDAEAREMTRRFGPALKAPPLLLPGAGHYPHVEEPQKVGEAILSFVAGSDCVKDEKDR